MKMILDERPDVVAAIASGLMVVVALYCHPALALAVTLAVLAAALVYLIFID